VSPFPFPPARFQATARIPYVSYNENELILAEAYNKTGDDVNALLHLNNARATVPLPALVGLTGVTLLDSIMIEKYAAMFQNIESINDYRRTCLPAITPSANSQGFSNVPGRLFYPQTERNVNPNIPTPTVQLATHGFRNEGDVHACQNDNAP
jgi:starch-binding outer membrane protein, SusD/RagB family